MRHYQLLAVLFGLSLATTLHAQEPIVADELQLGVLCGRFIYDGDPPKPDASPLAAIQKDTPLVPDNVGRLSGVELAYRQYLKAGIVPRTIDDSLLVGKEGGLANVVVFATSRDAKPPVVESETAKSHVLQIKNGQFLPRVLVVTAGSKLDIKNSDPLSFGFHLMPMRNQEVNYRLPPNSTRSLVLSKPERIPIHFRSDRQSWAAGFLLVHGNPHCAVSAADGTFSIPNLPPGEWEFHAWHENVGYLKNWPKGRFRFEIEAGNNDLGDVKLAAEMFRPESGLQNED